MDMGPGISASVIRKRVSSRRTMPVPNPFPTSVGGAASTFSQNGNVLTVTSGAQLDAKRVDGLYTVGRKAGLKLTINGTGTIRVYAGSTTQVDQVVSGSTVQRTYEKASADASYLIIRVQSATFTGTVTVDEIYEE